MKLKHMPLYLYHGTSASNLPWIQRHGLRPRGKHGNNNWEHTIGSNPDTVYLTNAYALYFAWCATKDAKDDGVIFEVDIGDFKLVNPMQFQADEDALEQAYRERDDLPATWSMKQRTMWYRKRAHKYSAVGSLNALGTCGYRGTIPFAAISRYIVVSRKQLLHLSFIFDPMISILNYAICGEQYRNSIPWLFGDTDKAYSAVGRPLDDTTREGIRLVLLRSKVPA